MREDCVELAKWHCSSMRWDPIKLDVLLVYPDSSKSVPMSGSDEPDEPVDEEWLLANKCMSFLQKKADGRAKSSTKPSKPRKPRAKPSKPAKAKPSEDPDPSLLFLDEGDDTSVADGAVIDEEREEKDDEETAAVATEWSLDRHDALATPLAFGEASDEPGPGLADDVADALVAGPAIIPEDPFRVDIDAKGAHLFFRRDSSVRVCRVSYIRPFTMNPSVSVYCTLHRGCHICKNRNVFPDDYLDKIKAWLTAGEIFSRDDSAPHKESPRQDKETKKDRQGLHR